MTGIEWTKRTWNPTTGCDQVSPGCDHCYAKAQARRLKHMGQPRYQTDGRPETSGPGFGLAVHENVLKAPLRWHTPHRVFVNSMSDAFHPQVPDAFLARMFAVMALTPQHTYQLLTKRHARMRSLLNTVEFARAVWVEMYHLSDGDSLRRFDRQPWPVPNLWVGVSVEDQQRTEMRLPALIETPAAVRFVSAEPLLGPVDLKRALWTCGAERGHGLTTSFVHAGGCCERLHGLDWVIVGGESGTSARPLELEWVRSLVDQTRQAGAAVFVKQLGKVWAREHGAASTKGSDPRDWPENLRVRQMPTPVGRRTER
ncbi:hypothetical protein BJF83_22460 [Nocardiopsis sp. CNR-923]|uniref:DUF5131 family protein n=1 Tax=Nocardiopsis sp. CNR-923 TaxID=1904965 RepID=UPI0009599644|nr:phage Gp37/Gp68 family protein [Nocardiopsis sp. CNR-923]OLT25847.1 hypothetical protein BJF83_22460 [Nocardiopsis sp. CNR-923]